MTDLPRPWKSPGIALASADTTGSPTRSCHLYVGLAYTSLSSIRWPHLFVPLIYTLASPICPSQSIRWTHLYVPTIGYVGLIYTLVAIICLRDIGWHEFFVHVLSSRYWEQYLEAPGLLYIEPPVI